MTAPAAAVPSPRTALGDRPLAHPLAVLGGGFLLVQAWVLGSWLADGPRSITEFRVHEGKAWVAAIVLQAGAVVLALAMLAHLVRSCRRERRLTFDAKLCIAMALTAWLDVLPNVARPLWMLSSEFVNVSSWGGHLPFQQNEAAGDLPWPVLFLGLVYAFGTPAILAGINVLMRRAATRWPGLSRGQLIALAFLVGGAIHPVLEIVLMRLDVWALAGAPEVLSIGVGVFRYSFLQVPMSAFMLGTLASVRYLRNDRGETIVERGVAGGNQRVRAGISLLALVGVCNAVWVVGCGFQAVTGQFAGPYPDAPPYLANGLCDAGSTTGTDYGPCLR
jgi:hypothetical protein